MALNPLPRSTAHDRPLRRRSLRLITDDPPPTNPRPAADAVPALPVLAPPATSDPTRAQAAEPLRRWTEPVPAAPPVDLQFGPDADFTNLPATMTVELAAALELARQASRTRLAPGTRRNYTAAWTGFATWCTLQHLDQEQATAEIVASYSGLKR